MAQLAIATAGAIIGGYFGGPTGASIGWSIGSAAGGLLFAERSNTLGPKLSDLLVTTSTYGIIVPKVFGAAKVGGNIIWATALEERERTEEVGKGGGSSYTTYTYFANFAVALCEGEITAVRRIWANGELIYNVGDDAAATDLADAIDLGDNIVAYRGTESQTADPTIEQWEGAGNVPGFRGTAYAVFREFALEKYGNRIPALEFEVVAAGGLATPTVIREYTSIIAGSGQTSAISAFGPQSARLDGGSILMRAVSWESGATPFNWIESVVAADGDTVLVPARTISKPTAIEYNFANIADTATLAYNDPDYCMFGARVDFPETGSISDRLWILHLPSGAVVDASQLAGGVPRGFVVLPGPNDTAYAYCFYDSGLARIAVPTRTDDVLALQFGGLPAKSPSLATTSGSIVGYTWDTGISHAGIAADAGLRRIVVHPTGDSPNRVLVYDADTLELLSVYDAELQHTVTPDVTDTVDLVLASHGGKALISYVNSTIEYARTIDVTEVGGSVGSPLPLVDISVNASAGLPIGSNTRGVAGPGMVIMEDELWTYATIVNDDPPTLEDVVVDICVDAGYQTSDIDASDLSGIEVKGFVRSTRTTASGLLEILSAAYGFDLAEVDGKLTARLRGAVADATIAEDDYVGAPRLTTVRAQESELPSQIDVSYIAHGADYEVGTQHAKRMTVDSVQQMSIDLPIVLADSEAAAMTRRMLYEAWLSRSERSFSLGPKWAKLVPGDVVTLPIPDESSTATCRITRIARDGIKLDLQSVDVDAAAYTQPDSAPTIPGGVTGGGNLLPLTDVEVLDVAPLRDRDDDYAVYVAATSYSSSWPGAVLLARSTVGGPWSEIGSASAKSLTGRTLTALGDSVRSSGEVDLESTVDVGFDVGTLPTTVDLDTFLTGDDNTFLIGAEIVRARVLTELYTGVYRLSFMLRGLQGTEGEKDSHVAGERVVLLTGALRSVPLPSGWIGMAGAQIAGVTLGASYETARPQSITFGAVRLKPVPPSHAVAVRNRITGDIVLKWVRGARIDNRMRDYVGVRLDEDEEAYEVDILDADGDVLRTITGIGSETTTYTSEMELADFGTEQIELSFDVYQISSRIGRGFPAEVRDAAVVSDDPVVLMHFDGADGSTTFTDESGLVWTKYGDAQIDTAQSKFGGASLLLDGTGDYLTTPATASLAFGTNDFTVECWVRTAVTAAKLIIGCYANSSQGWSLNTDSSNYPYFNCTGDGIDVQSSQALSTNTWHHLAVTRRGSALRIFIDGVLKGSATNSESAICPGVVRIGRLSDSFTSLDWNGHIDELRVLNGRAVYTEDFTPPTSAF